MTYLSMKRGDDRELEITATESLAGADVTWTARRRPYSEDVLIQKTTPAGITVVGAVATVALDAADTADLEPDVLYWDVEVVQATRTHTIATGRLAVEPDVTYPA